MHTTAYLNYDTYSIPPVEWIYENPGGADASEVYFENRGLIENRPYCWRFEIENNYEKTSISSRWTVRGKTSSATAPIAPDPIVKVKVTGGRIYIQWSVPGDSGGVKISGSILASR